VAREILLRFRTKNYERARKVAERIAERAKDTLHTAKSLGAELREQVEQARRTAELRKRGAAMGRRGAAASARDLQAGQRQRFGEALGAAGEAREKGEALAALFSGEDVVSSLPSLIGGVGQLVPGLGPFAALLAPLAEKLLGYLEERLEQELAKQEALFTARLEEERFQRDYTRRLEEDPRFAREQAKRALQLTLAEEARLGKRVQKTTADLLTDFDL